MIANRKIKNLITCPLFLLAVVFLKPTTLVAQDESHNEIWATYTTRKYIYSKRFWWRGDYGAISSYDSPPSTTLLARQRLIFNIGNNVELFPAIDLRYSIYPDLPNITEIRTWQGAVIHWPQVKRVMFDHYYRFEQRFYLTEGSTKDEIGLRSRYRLRMRIPFNKKAVTDNTYFTDLTYEAFFPHDDNITELFANTIRLGATFGYNHNTKWRYYLMVSVDKGRNNYDNNVTTDRYILSVRVRKTLLND